MATTTTNFGWDIPQSTDLVKDGATAIAALGQDIDTALVDLKGGTTGQVLAKASGTDLDFSWVAQDDSNAIQNAIVDAKGDLIGATAADTPARLAVGTNGQVLTADSTAATGLAWAAVDANSMTLLSTTTLSGASTTISSISGSYKNLQIVIRDFLPSADAASMYLRFNTDTGSNYVIGGTGFPSPAATTFAEVAAGIDNAVTENIVVVDLFDYANTATYKVGQFTGINNVYTGSNWVLDFGMLAYKSTSAISSLTVYPSSGTLTGSVLIYGVK
jgi:hypothetical protein